MKLILALVTFYMVGCGSDSPPIKDFDYNSYKTFQVKNLTYDQCRLTTQQLYFEWPYQASRITDIYSCNIPRDCKVYVDHYNPTTVDSDCAYHNNPY